MFFRAAPPGYFLTPPLTITGYKLIVGPPGVIKNGVTQLRASCCEIVLLLHY